MKKIAALVLSCGLAASASASGFQVDDLGTITIFGTEYTVLRQSLNDITFENPALPGNFIPITEVEGAHLNGPNTMLISSDAGDGVGAPTHFIYEIEIINDIDGNFVEAIFSRLVAAEDEVTGFGVNGGFDLNTSGITINTGADGFNPGNVVTSTGDEQALGFDEMTGLIIAGPVNIDPPNSDSEDIEYIAEVDQFFTVCQDGPNYCIIRYDDNMNAIDAYGDIPVAQAGSLTTFGEPKGIFQIQDTPLAPAALQGSGGVVVLTLDDEGPGLEALQYDGTPWAYEPMTDMNGDPAGTSRLDVTPFCVAFSDPFQLQMECGEYDSSTGRLYLFNQGEDDLCAFLYVLDRVDSPCNAADIAEEFGVLDLTDVSTFVGGFVGMDPIADVAEPFGVWDLTDVSTFVAAFNDGCP